VKFLLDTDSVSYALRGEGGIADQLRALKPSELAMSAITLAELRFGAERRRSRRLHRLIEAFAGDVAVVPFDGEAANRFGKVAAALISKGTPIGTLDTMIAAHALQLGLTLVTHDSKHFGRVRGLKIADWVQP
jgi:tRNA(fMet)-specific endonuclease VapC